MNARLQSTLAPKIVQLTIYAKIEQHSVERSEENIFRFLRNSFTPMIINSVNLLLFRHTNPRKQKNDTSEDPEIHFAITMRSLLSEIPATETQARLDNLYKGVNLPSKAIQPVEPNFKPLMGQEALNALISIKPSAKRQRIQPFRRRKNSTIPKDTDSSNTAKTPNTAVAITNEASQKTKNQNFVVEVEAH
ncbi:hypothetical protein AYI70_g11295 [Smittium culicis]|uniref:Uncharacterized protein n=1 Tax=Smittium culicis TaxID=133412 RepID=A0A1R1X2K6_9FUNG|nr:hypothetical protein AYI70_g11295 [Smittium culicis]